MLTYLQGITGIIVGLIVSAICSEEAQAIHVNIGTIYPILMLSGVIWPLEAIPYPMRYFSYLIPLTVPAMAMRDIFLKGWGLEHKEVWEAILVNLGFIVVLLSVAVLLRKKRVN